MENNFSLKLNPKAAQDIENILDYVSNILCNQSAASRLVQEFEDALLNVCSFPEMCPIVDNEYLLKKNIRKLVVENYILFYVADKENKEIIVIRVLYGMMNYIDIL